MRAFVNIRYFVVSKSELFSRISSLENKISIHDINFKEIFNLISNSELSPNQGIFFDGQIFDAHSFVSDLIRSAKKSIILIDNYVDDSVLTLFSKNVNLPETNIYTKNVSKQLILDIKKFNEQYFRVNLKELLVSHDRFLIIDGVIYHFGASLKDLGKSCFAFSKLNIDKDIILSKLK